MRTTAVEIIELDDGTSWLRQGTMIRQLRFADGIGAPPPAKAARRAPKVEAAPKPKRKGGRPKGKPAKAPKEPAAASGNRSDSELVAEAQQLFTETDEKLPEIASRVALNYQTLYGVAIRNKWMRR